MPAFPGPYREAANVSELIDSRPKMSPAQYFAYGLHIESDIDCPELPPDRQARGNPDVAIHLKPPLNDISKSLEDGYYEVRPDVFRLAIAGVGQYVVEHGSRISIEPLAGASTDEIRLFLLGSAMGALLYQRGMFPLHGSAIETRWGAMILVGGQGIGKSTLAAEFHRRKYRLLSDDVCALAASEDGLQVLPALAHFRLCADAYERLGTPDGARFNVDKFVVPMNEGYCPDPTALRAIHVLVEHESELPEFEVLRGFDRIQRLLENLYRPQYLKGQNTQGDLMRMAAQIAEKTTIAQVSRRRDPAMIERLVDFLELEWAKHFDAIPMEDKN